MQKLELRRNLFHFLLGVVLVILLYFDIINAPILFAILVIGIILSAFHAQTELPVLRWFIKTFERPGEYPGKGAITYFMGVIIAVVAFEKHIALASILILAVGDSLAHYVGRFHGKHKHPFNENKLLEGSVVGFLAASYAASLFLKPHIAVISAFCALLFESLELRFGRHIIDDNISMPLIAGLVATLLEFMGSL